MRIKKNVKLAQYTTFHIGGKAEFFAGINKQEELNEALNFTAKNKLKLSVLGGGSNTLLPDKGLRGLVLKISIRGISLKKTGENILVSAGAGENWDTIVAKTVARGFGGIENLSLIPGTVGGAVYQNIGAYGAELKDTLESVEVFDINDAAIKTLLNKDCGFGYRDSIFQHPEGQSYIILRAIIRLSRSSPPKVTYPDLIKYFENKRPTIQEVRKAVVKIRKSKLDYPAASIGTAGSFFKNPVISTASYQLLVTKYPDIIGKDFGKNQIKLFAGQLTEKAGWKGKRFKNVGVSKRHAMVLVSYKRAKSKDVLVLAKKIQKSVKAKFGVKLEPEVKIMT